MSNNTVAVRHPRRDVTGDRRDMCNHRSMDISVMISNVTVPKYTRLTLPIVVMICIGTDIKGVWNKQQRSGLYQIHSAMLLSFNGHEDHNKHHDGKKNTRTLTFPIIRMVILSTGWVITTVGLATSSRLDAAVKVSVMKFRFLFSYYNFYSQYTSSFSYFMQPRGDVPISQFT